MPEPELLPWDALKAFTDARIAQGRTGTSLPTRELLRFQQAHAAARDAVHTPADFNPLEQALTDAGETVLHVQSRARNRSEYLRCPDLGRKLDNASIKRLTDWSEFRNSSPESQLSRQSHPSPKGRGWRPRQGPDLQSSAGEGEGSVCLVVADGLSASGLPNALPVLRVLLPELRARRLTLCPIVFAGQARVALGDEVARTLGARLVLVLIGERPGLSSPDSLGAYLTFNPQPLTRDSARNCVSNIRPAGLDARTAAWRITHLISEALRRELSGVNLKDESGDVPPNFALPSTSTLG